MASKLVLSSVLPLAIALASACGGDRKFNNPNDPNGTAEGGKDSGTSDDPTGSGPDGAGAGATPGAGGTCLTGTCAPAAGTVFDFANAFKVTPTGCTGVGAVRLFDTGTDLRFFLQANCGQRNAVYTFTTTYTGANAANLALASADCNSATGTTGFAVDQGAAGYLVAYECKNGGSSYETRVVAVDATGSVGTSAVYETGTTSRSYFMAWNGTANAFGLARDGQFQRYASGGSAIGGPVAHAITGLGSAFAAGGAWYLMNYYLCSRVNTSGALECNGIQSSVNGRKVLLDPAGPSVVSAESGRFATATVNPATCALTSDSSEVTPSNALDTALGALSLNGTYGAFTFKTQKSLVVTTFAKGDGAIQSEASVAGYASALGAADTKVIQGKIYVAYDKDGDAFASYSTQSVSP
jgi:hypothetical protein